MEERRKYIRIEAQLNVNCGLLGDEVSNWRSNTRNISRNGIAIPLRERLVSGTPLNLEVTIPDDPPPVRILGEVVWVSSAPSAMGFETGMKFLEINPVDRGRIIEYVCDLWRQKVCQK